MVGRTLEKQRLTLLLVEDDQSSREALAEVLSERFEVAAAANAEEAWLQAIAHKPALALLDVRLAGIDGISLLKQFRADVRFAAMPVILLSAYADGRSRAEGLRLGADDYLGKPFDADELEARIDRQLARCDERASLLEETETDARTGLGNQRALSRRLPQEIARAQRSGAPLTCLAIDIDHLKTINDTRGHAGGDRAIGIAAGAIREGLRTGDFAARTGGDEFVVLLVETDVSGARAFAQRLRREVSQAADAEGLTLSIGAAQLEPGEAGAQLLEAADIALYEAKEAGRDRCESRAPRLQPPPAKGKQVLVVDDDADVRAALRDLMEMEGFAVLEACHGREALSTLSHEHVDFILLDMMMPDMSGTEFRRWQLRHPELATIPVAVMSASGPEAMRVEGVVARLNKPIRVEHLLSVMGRYAGDARGV